MDYCVRARVHGILTFGMGVTLREGNREYFYAALDKHFPGMKEKYQRKFGYAYEIPSDNDRELMALLHKVCRENKMLCGADECFRYLHEFPDKYEQMTLF